MKAARIAAAAASGRENRCEIGPPNSHGSHPSTGRARSKKVEPCAGRMGLLAASLEINQRLTDALKVSLYERVGVEVVLRVVAHHIAVLALKTGEESVDLGMGEQVVRRGSRNTGCNPGQVGGGAVGGGSATAIAALPNSIAPLNAPVAIAPATARRTVGAESDMAASSSGGSRG